MSGGTHERPTMMLLRRDRHFYCGPLLRSGNQRCPGSLSVYVAMTGELSIEMRDEVRSARRIVAVPPFTPHRIDVSEGKIAILSVETETVTPEAIDKLVTMINDDTARSSAFMKTHAAIHDVSSNLDRDLKSIEDFDRYFLGVELPSRAVDHRIRLVLDYIDKNLVETHFSANECAHNAHLSISRFLHLFKDNTHIPFRSYRKWKRARLFLGLASANKSLTEMALELGYPDSTHFSHSIRKSFGTKPQMVRDNLRSSELRIDITARAMRAPDTSMQRDAALLW